MTGALIGFLVWLFLCAVVYALCSYTYKGTKFEHIWTFKPNYGGLVIFMLIGLAINHFFF